MQQQHPQAQLLPQQHQRHASPQGLVHGAAMQ
jgi:hypothetical protein